MRKAWIAVYALALSAYAVFTLLDTFVLPKNVVSVAELQQSQNKIYQNEEKENDVQDIQSAESENKLSSNQAVVTENSYEDGNISIQIHEIREYNTDIYVAEVTVSDPSFLKAGLAGESFGQNISAPTSQIAEEHEAILAINGDYYGFRDRGYVMRNGYLYRDSASRSGNQDLVIDENGDFFLIEENETDAQVLAENGAVQIFSFGPGLIQDGKIIVSENTEVDQAMRSNPRTAIGQIDSLHYVFVVSDGRTSLSEGLSLYELAEVMQSLGCKTAYNLDGGGSSTMWFMGEVVNNPTNGRSSKERSVSDIVYIG